MGTVPRVQRSAGLSPFCIDVACHRNHRIHLNPFIARQRPQYHPGIGSGPVGHIGNPHASRSDVNRDTARVVGVVALLYQTVQPCLDDLPA